MDGKWGPSNLWTSSMFNPPAYNFNTSPYNQSTPTPQYSSIRIFPSSPDPKPVTSPNNWSSIINSTPSASAQPVAIPGAQYAGMTPAQARAAQEAAYSNIHAIGNTLYGIPKSQISTWANSNFTSTPSMVKPASWETQGLIPWLFNSGIEKAVLWTWNVVNTGLKAASVPLLWTAAAWEYAGKNLITWLFWGQYTPFNQTAGVQVLGDVLAPNAKPSISPTSLQNITNNVKNATSGTPAAWTAAGQTSPASSGATDASWKFIGPVEDTSTTSTGNYSGDAAIQAQWDALSPADQARYKPVFDAAYNKLGAGTFFYGAMSDKKLLQQMFPGLQEKDLPTGASLAWQMADLQTTLKTQYWLDSLLKQKTQLASETKNFTQDMADYISGKDQMMGQINKMIDAAESKITDTQSPESAKAMSSYLNYLYTLKGRQNKNYTDYLNQAITYQNDQVAKVGTEYTNMLNAYNTDFKTQSDLKTADYNQWYTVLTDMYNKLDGALGSQLDIQGKQAAIDQTYAGMAIDAANAQAKNNSVQWTKDFQNSGLTTKILSTDTQTKDQLLPWVDLASVMARATEQWYNPQAVIDSFQQGANNSITASAGDMSNLNQTMYNITNILKNLNSTTQGQYKDIINQIVQGMWSTIGAQLSSYVSSNSAPIVNAVKDLNNSRNKTATDFSKNHSDLDPVIAQQLFNYYKANPEYANKPQSLFSSTGTISTNDIPQIQNTIANSIAWSWTNNLITSINQ